MRLPLIVLSLPALLAGAAGAAPVNTAMVPVPLPHPEWFRLHFFHTEAARHNEISVAFLGDSITADWGGQGQRADAQGGAIFKAEFAPFGMANFAVPGDRTETMLWRVQNGLFARTRPRVVLLNLGTNNLAVNTPEEIAQGIAAVILEIWKYSPGTKVLLMGIFPRGRPGDPLRAQAARVNALIAKFDDGGRRVRFLDIGGRLVRPDGWIGAEVMWDSVHLTAVGYRIWSDAVRPLLAQLYFAP